MKAASANANHSNHFVLDPRNALELRSALKQDPQEGLKQAAQQFEALMLQMVLKSMREAGPKDGLLDNDQTRLFTSVLDQQWAQQLSAEGGLGFAKRIEQQLGRGLGGADSVAQTASLNRLQEAYSQHRAASHAASFAGPAGGTPSTSAAGALGVSGDASATGRDFVNRVWPQAVDAANSLGVPPHFLVAQAALESNWGRNEIKLADGSTSYNVFGVKAGRSWQGKSVEVQTTEYVDGVAQSASERFRAYGSYAEAFQDYANLLRTRPRFSGVLGKKDGMQFAQSLQQAGYATDPQYADKLARIIGGPTLRQALVG